MVKATYVDKNGLKKGAWTEEEDNKLRSYVLRYGHWNWRLLPKFAGIDRCGKSCRLRWMNYLKPGIKRGNYNEEERDLIAKLHHELGNKWSDIAAKLPGRTDNDIKNYWHTHLQKRQKRTTESGRLAEISEKEQSSELSNSDNLEKDSDVSSAAPTLRSRKLRKSDVSYDVFILESSSSKCGDADWDPDSSSPDKNFSETLPELNPLSINSEATDDSGEFLDLLSGFHDSFWTEPFTVDRCSYNHDYNFCIIDDGGLFSSSFMF